MDWFATNLLTWHQTQGRKHLPWQQELSSYRVWVSEIMLQQTQVATVISYYLRFMQRFPDVTTLANANLDEVLHLWTGLGYYARARNLHKAAAIITQAHKGEFPTTQEALEALPGIGPSTAGAIRSIAQAQHATILDGNVKRVLTRFHAVAGYPDKAKIAQQLWQLAETHTPKKNTGTYTQAIMDLGATLCVRRKPKCEACPVSEQCSAHLNNTVQDYPEAKSKKAKPVRCSRFFVVSDINGATLLEQKPLNGLWGGLWTPPQRQATYTTNEFLNELGLSTDALIQQYSQPSFRHTFTHFHLDIEPIYLTLKKNVTMVQDTPTSRWVFPDKLDHDNNPIGLCAPAVKLLANLKEPHNP